MEVYIQKPLKSKSNTRNESEQVEDDQSNNVSYFEKLLKTEDR
jgi:hypothetical protein